MAVAPLTRPPREPAGRHGLQVDLLEAVGVVAVLEAGGGVAGHDLAAADQGDLVAERLGLLEVVRGQEDRRALLVQAADVAPQLLAQLDVDAGGGLVEDDQARLVQQGAGEQQAALHAARELGGAGVALGAQVEDVDHLVGALLGRGLLHAVVAAVVDERLAHGQEAVQVRLLLGDADLAAGLHAVRRQSEHERLALGDPDQVADGADQRGLAGAVGPEQTEEAAGGHLEVERVEGEGAVVVALGQAAELQSGFG